MRRHARLLRVRLRAAALVSMQYRLDFFLGIGMAFFWTATALVPLMVLFRLRPGVAGWSWPEALVVVGFFTVLKGFLAGAMQPALMAVVEHVRRGTLDFVLLKPADAQFLVSTARFDLARGADVVAGLGIVGFAMAHADTRPGVADVALSALLLGGGIVILYSTWILAVSLAFHVVKVDNLAYLIVSTYDAARWPSSVFRGVLAVVFTFIVPLALMTTYPALALLQRMTFPRVALALGVAAAFFAASRLAWLKSVARYTSAGG